MSLIPKELDEKRLASFKTSLLNLRGAILDQHRRNRIRRQGGGGGGGADGATKPSRQQQQQQQQRRQQQRRPLSPSNAGINNNNVGRNVNQSTATATGTTATTKSKMTTFASSPMMSSLASRIKSERDGLTWIIGIATMGAFLGFAVGAGWFAHLGRGVSYGNRHRHHRRVPTSPMITTAHHPSRNVYAMSSKKANDTAVVVPHATFTSSSSSSFPSKGGMEDDDQLVDQLVVSAWRVKLAGRLRASFAYRVVTLRALTKALTLSKKQRRFLFVHMPLWPPNWIIFRDADLSNVDVRAGGGLSPIVVSFLSLILPWRGGVLRKLARRDRVKVNLRDGSRSVERSSSFMSSILSSIFSSSQSNRPIDPYNHPMAFHALREYVIRFDNGYVHPDLGLLIPAPSGADRGLGMVSDTYSKCQVHCFPGTAEEKIKERMEALARSEQSERQKRIDAELMEEMVKAFPDMADSSMASNVGNAAPSTPDTDEESCCKEPVANDRASDPIRNTTTYAGIRAAVQLQQSISIHDSPYRQSEILLRIPLEAQITRKSALETLLPMVPHGMNGLEELDDAFIIALYLANERGLGAKSRIWPYVATLPPKPTCALNWELRQSVVDVVTAMSVEMGTDVLGWPTEIAKAAEMAELIATTLATATADMNLAKRHGSPAEDVIDNIRWALCQVASRAIAGRSAHGSLRLVPVMDMINHDAAAGKFKELTGEEKLDNGSFLDADENHAGTFVVTSRRHGERKPLKRGQELMANYNVPNYSPLDWFINMGYIPPERAGKWTMLEGALPRNYRGGFSRKTNNVVNNRDFGAFGSEPKIQIIRQHTAQ